ncbi:MAG: polyprenyl diphosphate synthase [Thermoleophilia bacterium]|nr:polyprenyl diphosphate synthase [Thermoleophilia bacterium]
MPHHVAIIMDGNGRWARRRGLPVAAGHRAGAEAVRRVVRVARERGVKQLTLYSFSLENWKRPQEEVEALMRLHEEMIEKETPALNENGCRVIFIGSKEGLSEGLLQKMKWAEDLTSHNSALFLFIAFNYGGRREIVDAVRRAAEEGVDPHLITEEDIARNLYSPLMRDPDLVIRTSGEKRLSNFLLWQSAYSELYFASCLWPDFDGDEFDKALADYAKRERRFGARTSSVAASGEPDA